MTLFAAVALLAGAYAIYELTTHVLDHHTEQPIGHSIGDVLWIGICACVVVTAAHDLTAIWMQ